MLVSRYLFVHSFMLSVINATPILSLFASVGVVVLLEVGFGAFQTIVMASRNGKLS